ncbi:MAG: hypothetical protein LBG09_02745 [Puniceicoccales bacterium]|nr:hypothetical protein [Puniceicoccales bacterium]
MGINLHGLRQPAEDVLQKEDFSALNSPGKFPEKPGFPSDSSAQKQDLTLNTLGLSGKLPEKPDPLPGKTPATTKPELPPVPAPQTKQIPASPPHLPLGQWTEPYIKNSVKSEGAASVSAKFSASAKPELEKIKDKIDWIKDLFDEIKAANISDLTILSKEIELMLAYHKDCFDELRSPEIGGDSAYDNCIKNLKKLQAAIQNLRNTVGTILDRVRLLAAKEDNPDLKKMKRELKLIDDYCREIMAIIDYLIERLTLLLRVYHECSFEIRSKGPVGTQTTRNP